MMNQNMKSFKKVLGAATRVLGAAFADDTDYRSWCYTGSTASIAPAMRPW